MQTECYHIWLFISMGDRVNVKGRGMGTVKFIGRLQGSGTELSIGVSLDKPSK